MKGLVESLNEAREDVYSVAISAIHDKDDLPVTCKIVVPAGYRKQAEKWLDNMVGNEFQAAEADTYDWEAEF